MNAPHPRLIALVGAAVLAGCSDATGPDGDVDVLPVIEHMLISIDDWDAETQRAGDITFVGGEVFIPFGKFLVGTNGPKITPELTWFVAEGTEVHAPITGVVSQIDVLYSDDYLIVLQQDGSAWEVGVEHVVDPRVQVGDRVTAGQVIATATPEDTPFGTIAFTELAVWLPADSDEEMIKKCPVLAFTPALRASFSTATYALAESWETHWGEDTYDTAAWTQPGCLMDELTEAQARNGG